MGKSWKGYGGQAEVAKLLTEWWRGANPEAQFASTPLSGGWKPGPAFKACGDVVCNKAFPFAVEVKFREGWTLENVVAARRSPVWGWWEQAQLDALKLDLEPMLWFRKNRQPWLVAVRWRMVARRAGARAPDVVYKDRDWVKPASVPCIYLASNFMQQDPTVFETGAG